MPFCSTCGAQIPDGTTTCAAHAAAAPAPAAATTGGIGDNLAGLLCYSPVGLIADIIFLVAEPYNRNRFIRFHAFQSLFCAVGVFVLAIGLMIVAAVLHLIPLIGWIISTLLWFAFAFGNLALWIMMMIKAYQMQMTKLPVVGDLAMKQAGA
jgi:uncharacterized membrane protein